MTAANHLERPPCPCGSALGSQSKSDFDAYMEGTDAENNKVLAVMSAVLAGGVLLAIASIYL